MAKEILFLLEAGKDFGYGHLTRCLALAQGLFEKNNIITMIIRGNINSDAKLASFDVSIHEWLDLDFLSSIVSQFDIVIIDSYHASEKICKYVAKNIKKVLFFDDFLRLSYPSGIVLNSAIGAEMLSYPNNPHLTYLLGSSYIPLRKDFFDASPYTFRKEINRILITFGGSDISDETPYYLKLCAKRFPNAEKMVVIGAGFKNFDKIQHESDKNTTFLHNLSAMEMVHTMQKSDLAISAAGQTVNELAVMGVPTIGIQIADNQAANYNNWKKVGFLIDDTVLYDNFIDLEKLRENSHKSGRVLVDGKGVERIVDMMLLEE